MAIYRRSRKPSYRKKRYVKKTRVPLATKKYVKRVTRQIRPEMKNQLDLFTETTINYLSQPYLIYEPAISQGDGKQNRDGVELIMKGVHFKGIVHNNSNQTAYVRFLILKTQGATDTAWATAEFFTDGSTSGATQTITDLLGSTRLATTKINPAKFKVCAERVIKLAPNTSTEGAEVKKFNIFTKQNQKVIYEAGTYQAANQDWRYIVVILSTLANNDVASTSTCEITADLKWYFVDP